VQSIHAEGIINSITTGEDRALPTVRIETSPVGTWRVNDKRSPGEHDSTGGGCSVRYEDRPANS
jgi:hypothetical protein